MQIIKEKCYLSEKRQMIFNSHPPPSRQLSPAGCHGDDFLVDLAFLIVGESEIAKKYNKGLPIASFDLGVRCWSSHRRINPLALNSYPWVAKSAVLVIWGSNNTVIQARLRLRLG